MTQQNRKINFEIEHEAEPVSKTQLKKEADQLKKLGLEILDLSPKQRATLGLDTELNTAFDLALKINRKKDGFRRQIQFIGKLLRQRDVEPIEMALDKLKASHQHEVDKFHSLEQLRDDIISGGDVQIQDFVDQHPTADRQKLRHLVRQAEREKKLNKAPASARELFKYLREFLG